MSDSLERLLDADVIAPLDLHFAKTLARLAPDPDPSVLLGAAMVSRGVTHGHVCIDLRSIVQRPLLDATGRAVEGLTLPSLFEWVMQLGSSPLVSAGERPTPLVFDGEARLYLTRYFRYQTQLASSLRARALAAPDHDPDALKPGLDRLFPKASADARQRLAAAVALTRRLAVICGGPGTGKTTTVVRILALLIERATERGELTPRIMLLAPTGKAAARLAESIEHGRSRLDCDRAIIDQIPSDAATIHRRLGFRPGSPTRFFHDAHNLLPADVVLVDEASMVDLALMAKLFDAIAPSARVILLGDKDQLASVEAGAILGDICNAGHEVGYSAAFRGELAALVNPSSIPKPRSNPGAALQPGIWDCVVHLTHSYRFGADSEIGQLARSVGSGDGEQAASLLSAAENRLSMVELSSPAQLGPALENQLVAALRPMLREHDPGERLHALSSYRLLCAHRRGAFGTQRVNQIIEGLLTRAGLIDPSTPWYDGRPIIVTHNDYQLELFNGDVGLLARGDDGRVYAWFPGPQGTLRRFLPSRLPSHESVYAMTVHKSQGSEFDAIGLLIPPQLSPVLTRELIYTGITRARERVTLYGTPQVLRDSIRRRVERASGLRDALWHDAPVTQPPDTDQP